MYCSEHCEVRFYLRQVVAEKEAEKCGQSPGKDTRVKGEAGLLWRDV